MQIICSFIRVSRVRVYHALIKSVCNFGVAYIHSADVRQKPKVYLSFKSIVTKCFLNMPAASIRVIPK